LDENTLIVFSRDNGRYSITKGDWKLILPSRKYAEELYDLATDPGETSTFASEFSERVETLKAKATSIVLDGRTTPRQPQMNDTSYWKDLEGFDVDS
jgi:arylsulfatase A